MLSSGGLIGVIQGVEMNKRIWKWTALLSLVPMLAMFAPQCAAADDDDPPARVARLNYTKGDVSFQPGGTDDWVAAVVNRPITTGDKLWTDRDARAELHIGSAAIRLRGETGFSFLNLTDRIVQMRLTTGTINVRLRRLDEDETFEVDTPNLAFSLLRPGEYRIAVNDAGDATVISVRGGEGEVTGGGQAFTVHADQRVTFTGIDTLDSEVSEIGGYDEFDEWSRERDHREEHAKSTRYVSRDVIGYEDLDEYGDWRPAPEYGYVWVPRTVVVGWAPYRFGHWVWIWPWGWTWVDDAPWGFAPFHYGRWVYWGGYWGWVPCPVVARPVYAPALVAWVGGPHFSLALSFGHVGGGGVAWFPLGPREVYVPPYRVSRVYVTNINVTNTTVTNTYVTNVYNNYATNNVTNIKYVNRAAPGAVTAVPQNAFTSAQPVARNVVKVDEKEIAAAPVSTAVAVAPQQKSVLGAGAERANAVRPPASVQNRAVVAKTPPPPRPVPFTAQQKAIQANEGRPLDAAQMRQLRPAAEQQIARPNIRVAPPAPKPVPVETVARPRSGQPGQPAPTAARPSQPAAPEAARPGRPERPAPQAPPQTDRTREDRPPSAQRPPEHAPPVRAREREEDRPQADRPAERPARPNAERPDRPPASPRDLEREERDRQRFEEQKRKLEEKHQQEQQKLQEHQEREHRKLQQQQERQRQKEQKHKSEEKPPEKKPASGPKS